MDASGFRHMGDAIELIFKLALYAFPASLILNVVLGVLLWLHW